MRPLVFRATLALSSTLLSGCADPSGRAALDFAALPPVAYREELRIGSVDDPAEGFSRIGGVQVGLGGDLYVLETEAREVRVYDASGARIRTTLGDTLEIAWGGEESAERGTLGVTRLRTPADTLSRVAISYPLRPTAAHLDSIVMYHGERLSERFPRRTVEDAVRATFAGEPALHPPISTYRAGTDGSLWLRRSPATDDGAPDGTASWIVIGADGGVRGTLRLPGSMSPSWIDGDTAWIVDRDAFDVPWLVRITIDG